MIYSIIGNIGSGKSTILESLKDRNYIIFQEPLNEWFLIHKFYENLEKYTFPFQYQILLSYYKQYEEILMLDKNIKIFTETTPYTSKHVFLEALKETTNCWKPHHEKCFNEFYEQFDYKTDILFYLDLSPEKCIKRIMKRSRNCEKNISIEYIRLLDKKYKKMMENSSFKVIKINVGEKSVETIRDEILSYCD
jgi:deoxyadenosine/deoxycytidine kinase